MRPSSPRNVPLTRSTSAHPDDRRPKAKLRFPDVTGIQPPPVRVVSKPKAKAQPVVIQPPVLIALPGRGLEEKGPPIDLHIEPANEPAPSAFHAFADVLTSSACESRSPRLNDHAITTSYKAWTFTSGRRESHWPRRQIEFASALRDNALTPAAASRLAGKLAFLTQATFGAVGKAALQPLYSRSHDTSPHATDELSDGLRAALNAIHAMLRDIQPRSSSAGPPATPGLPVTEGEFPIIRQSPAPHNAVPIPESGSESDSDATADYRDDPASLLALVESSDDVLLQLLEDFYVPDFVPLDGDGFGSWLTRQDKIKAGSITPEMARRYAKEIRLAKLDEFKSYLGNGALRLADKRKLTKDVNFLTGRWVLTVKVDKNGYFSKFKARWVCRGFQDKHAWEQQTDSPTATRCGFQRTLRLPSFRGTLQSRIAQCGNSVAT